MTEYTITREDADKDARCLRDALEVLRAIGGGVNQEATQRLNELADSIEEQAQPTEGERETNRLLHHITGGDFLR